MSALRFPHDLKAVEVMDLIKHLEPNPTVRAVSAQSRELAVRLECYFPFRWSHRKSLLEVFVDRAKDGWRPNPGEQKVEIYGPDYELVLIV